MLNVNSYTVETLQMCCNQKKEHDQQNNDSILQRKKRRKKITATYVGYNEGFVKIGLLL